MNQMFTTQAFDQTGQLFKEATVPANVQALAEKSVVATRDLYAKTATAVHDSAKALTNVTDLAWANSKMLNEKAAANLTSNLDAAFVAAQAMATAKSLPEISKIQIDFMQKFVAQASEQTKEFVELSTRATQTLFETTQAVATNSLKPKS